MTAAPTAQQLADALVDGPNGRVPGAVVGISRGPGTDLGCAGTRNGPDGELPMTPDTAHDLASVTKVLATTTCLLRLASDRVVGLADRVSGWLPDFCGGAKDLVTVRDLLQHRGGLWEWQPLYCTTVDPDAARGLAATLPLRYAPDTRRAYSDLGFILLGRVIEAATGSTLDAAVAELVTRPLGLTATRYRRPEPGPVATGSRDDRVERRMAATGEPYPVLDHPAAFTGWRDRPVVGEPNDGNVFHALGGCAGHAGLFSTVPELLTWAAALAAPEPPGRLWRPEIAATFFTAGPNPAQALGFRRTTVVIDEDDDDDAGDDKAGGPVTALGHPGFTGCAVAFVPGRGTAVVMATNRLLVPGTPPPTDELFAPVLRAALTTPP
ncbi:beta-lactamase family protein [Nakamurella flavida]|uniref:Beta-lactamase family protein n=1 Tax=Nakamurella flavida TaxID=363630 RepID=A0A938YLP4_9ACTN|nr:serine hydrolase domain-containing protein [Nakamurella flavida]MBM9475549.1 beta-lactamase family protein [Nakamurella flavida]MDP9778176.1 CubicO group peptidase (beta-lactamase class C family) [Nakamurella flavida]